MKKYDSYKNLNLRWLDRVPEHWEVKRLKDIMNFGTGLSITKQDLRDKGIPCVNYGEIHSKYGVNLDTTIHMLKCVDEKYLEESTKAIIKKGDFVFADTSEDVEGAGNFTHLKSEDDILAGYHTVTAKPKKRLSSSFLAFEFDSLDFRTQIRESIKGVKVFSVTQSILKNTKVWMPPIEEQTQIANYLDHKTNQIDDLISKKEQLIELLKEERTAIINQAVTKGLDPNVPMKDSGIEWLGEIPEGWEKSSLKWYSQIYSGGTPSKVKDEYWINGNIPWLNSGTVNQGDITKSSHLITEEALANSSAKWIPKDSLVIALAGQGKTKGMVAQVMFKSTCNQSMGIIVPNQKIHNRFLLFWLRNNYQNIRNLGGGDKRDGLNLQMIGGIPIPIPPLNEQKKIANFLDDEILRIGNLQTKVLQEIELLKEYKTALISEVVTGKVDVSTALNTGVREEKY